MVRHRRAARAAGLQAMTFPTPLCKHCTFYKKLNYVPHPLPFSTSSQNQCVRRSWWTPVLGEMDDARDCESERGSRWFRDKCGPEGKYFMARK